MRAGAAIVQLTLCVAAVVAFFPFMPAWHKDKLGKGDSDGITFAVKAAKVPAMKPRGVATRMPSKYGGPRNVEMVTNDALKKRENRYQIQEAVNPKDPMTAGINQDGTDFAYFVRVELGSKHKALNMLLDTGAGSSWVMGPGCKDQACSMHSTFGPEDSDTFHDTQQEFTVSYGSGMVNGKLIEDSISLAGASFDFKFGMAGTTSTEFVKFPFDGILGLSMTRGNNDNFFAKMSEASKMEKNMFCVALNRASDGPNHGEIKFGSVNQDKFTGNISYTPLASQDGEWSIPIDDMAFDGKEAKVGGVHAFIDTGTSFIFGPPDWVDKLHKLIPGSKTGDGQTYHVPCDTTKPLVFTFSGVDWEVSAQDWIAPKNSDGECTSNVYGYEVAKGAWLIGDTFLMNVYSVFDKDEKRIGFAKLAGPGSKQTATTATTATSMSRSTTASTSTTSGPEESRESGVSTQGPSRGQPGGGLASGVEKPQETAASSGVGGYVGKAQLAMTVAAFAAAML